MPPQGRVNTPQNRRILNGRVHQVNRTTPGGVVYMTCATKFCFGTARRLPNGVIVPGGQPHNLEICHADHTAQLKADFREELKASMQRNDWEPRQAYDLVVTMFEGDDRGNVRVLVPFNSVLTSLKRWRRWEFPACPTSLSEMADHLQNPDNDRLLEHRGARLLTTRRIVDAQEKLHLLIFNEEFVRNEFNNVSKIFIDGTFQTTPRVRDVYQLVTILGIKHDHALPFAYVLMASKTQVAYTAVLRAVSGIMNVATVKVVMTDYEQALRNSCREVFNQAHVAGCSVHYDRALLKKFKSLQLPRETRNRADVRLFVKKMMALAYLPPRMIVAEYTTLKNTLEAALRRRLSRFLTYYTRQWLTRAVFDGLFFLMISFKMMDAHAQNAQAAA